MFNDIAFSVIFHAFLYHGAVVNWVVWTKNVWLGLKLANGITKKERVGKQIVPKQELG